MIPIKSIIKKDFSKLSSSESVGAAVKVMEKMGVDYLLVEEGETRWIVTSRELAGYPSSRLLLDCTTQPVSTITEEALADEALRVLEGENINFLIVLNGEGIPTGITNRELIIDSLFQELEKLNREKDKYIANLRQTKEALRVSKESFHNIVNRNVDGILIIDRKGIVRFVNPAAENLFGRKAEELLGEMFGLPVVAGDVSEIDTIHSSGEVGVAEMRVIGTEWEGKDACLASVRDITERRRAERDLMIKDKAIASSINAIAIADFDGNLTYVNPAFLSMWGYKSDRDALKRSISQFWQTEEQAQTAIGMLYERRSWQTELVETRKNGSEFYAQLSVSPVIDSDDRPIAIMASFIDLTERKRAEEELRELDRKKSEFLSNVSHELRTPLQSIMGLTTLILDGKVPNPETQKEFLTVVKNESQCLGTLIGNLLDMSRLENGRFSIKTKRQPIREIILNALESPRIMASMQDIAITEDILSNLPEMEIDSERIRQVMANLLNNAIKFSEPGGNVTVKAMVKDRELLVQVADRGIGIPEEAIPRLFERFYRVGDTPWAGGTGLGLYISRQIIEAHGGRIWAESKKGEGSTFSFSLPLNKTGGDSHG